MFSTEKVNICKIKKHYSSLSQQGDSACCHQTCYLTVPRWSFFNRIRWMQVFNYFNISTTENKSSYWNKRCGFPLIEYVYVFRQKATGAWTFYNARGIGVYQLKGNLRSIPTSLNHFVHPSYRRDYCLPGSLWAF